jgi:hypothetical protein
MVNPGILPLSIIRGIEFPATILQCRDDSVTVSGTLSPDVTGTFAPCGSFAGYPLFILAGSPSTFIYFNTVAASYVIARLLTNAALTDYWSPAAPLTEPTGTYAAHGANTGTATGTDHPVDLTDYDVEAVVKRNSDADVTLDLNPSITSPSTGEITIPSISSTDTANFDFDGSFRWDLVLKLSGERVAVLVKGPFTVSDNITQVIPA